MKASNALSTLRVVSIAFGMIVAFAIPTFGQEAPLQNEASALEPAPAMNEVLRHNIENWALQGRGVPEDWSNHHLIFSNPGTEEDAIVNGTHDRWLSIVNDPRYILQQMKRSTGVKALADPETGSLGQAKTESIKKAKPKKGKLKKDWTEPLLGHGQVQPNMYPGKFSFSTTVASCSGDFVVYPTGVAGAAGAANIIAYNELYGTNGPNTGCGSASVTVPSVYWAYNTGGTVTTSPIISEGGSQVAFIQSNGTTASLVLLKWAPSATQTLSTPGTLTAQSTAALYRSCTAPCSYTVSLGANDTYSAPFYDYLADDAIYVGDDSGKLHKITGVFYGTTIAEATNWPVLLNASYKTASPVYDNTSGYVFVGNIATGTNAALYSVGSGNAGTTSGSKNATSSGLGDAIVDGTLLDPSTEEVYAFVTTDATGHNGVYQFAANFASGTAGTEEEVGFGGTGYYFYSGNFDNVYYSSATGKAGDLWVAGNTGGGSSSGGVSGVNLYRILINSSGAVTAPATAISGLTSAPPATITQDTVASAAGNGAVSSLSWSHTVDAGINVYLLVGLSFRVDNNGSGAGAGTFASGITANGTAMTCLVAISDNNSGSCGSGNTAAGGEPFIRSEIWSLSLGTVASTTAESIVATITVANSANGTNIAGTSISYFDVSSVTSGGDAVSNGTITTSASLSVTAASGLVVSNVALARSAGTVSATNTDTLLSSLIDPNGDSGFAHIEDATGSHAAPNPTMGFSWTALSPYALATVVLTPAAVGYGWASPITEFCNNGLNPCTVSGGATQAPGVDYLFFSVDRLSTAAGTCGTGAGDGCILGYSINTPTSPPTFVGASQVPTTNNSGCWSTSGIIVDNSVPSGTLAGASQIYTLEFNGNGAGGPTEGTYTSSACDHLDAAAPKALQASQSAP